MTELLIVGGGLFGSQAAAYARSKGIATTVFDPGLRGAASHAAAGLFRKQWAGKKLAENFHDALPILDRLYGIRPITLTNEVGHLESFLFVPPTDILEKSPIRERVTAFGDGWLEAGGRRYEGHVYIAAGVWCGELLPTLQLTGKAGAAFLFPGEREGRIRSIAHGRQALAFVRNPGFTYFSDGTAELEYADEHERATLATAASLGLVEQPAQRLWGRRPYCPGGPVFVKLSARTWLATGGRKMGTILGASFARRLIEQELQ